MKNLFACILLILSVIINTNAQTYSNTIEKGITDPPGVPVISILEKIPVDKYRVDIIIEFSSDRAEYYELILNHYNSGGVTTELVFNSQNNTKILNNIIIDHTYTLTIKAYTGYGYMASNHITIKIDRDKPIINDSDYTMIINMEDIVSLPAPNGEYKYTEWDITLFADNFIKKETSSFNLIKEVGFNSNFEFQLNNIIRTIGVPKIPKEYVNPQEELAHWKQNKDGNIYANIVFKGIISDENYTTDTTKILINSFPKPEVEGKNIPQCPDINITKLEKSGDLSTYCKIEFGSSGDVDYYNVGINGLNPDFPFSNSEVVFGSNYAFVEWETSIKENALVSIQTSYNSYESDYAILFLNVENKGLGVENIESDNDISIFPNPATSILNIRGIEINDKVIAEIYNMTGQLVFNRLITDASIDISDLSSGQYILKLKSEDKNPITLKFLKK